MRLDCATGAQASMGRRQELADVATDHDKEFIFGDLHGSARAAYRFGCGVGGSVAMATLTEVVAAVVVHSSAVAFSHFGVALDAPQAEASQPATSRVVARTPRKVDKAVTRHIGVRAAEAKA